MSGRGPLRAAAGLACALALLAGAAGAAELALPDCRGKERLDGPVDFDWPGIEHRRRELAAAQWSSFACAAPAAEVAAGFRGQLRLPPYDLEETSWMTLPEGSLGVYHGAAPRAWIYVWIVPQPGDPQRAWVVAARSTARRRCELRPAAGAVLAGRAAPCAPRARS